MNGSVCPSTGHLWVTCILLFGFACGDPSAPELSLPPTTTADAGFDPARSPESPPARGPGFVHIVDELRGLPRGDDQNDRFCSSVRNATVNDRFRNKMCAAGVPRISSLRDLLDVLDVPENVGRDSSFGLALAAHSAAISTRSVSSINPRVFLFTQRFFEGFEDVGRDSDGEIVISYTRGEPYIEIAAQQIGSDGFGQLAETHFYLVKFDKACESSDSCDAAHFYTDEFERDWVQVSVYEDLDIVNTTLDCTGCHEPASANGEKILLFAESQLRPVHWFSPEEAGPFVDTPRVHYNPFYEFHGRGSGYGVITAEDLDDADGGGLWGRMYRSGASPLQPIDFNGTVVRNEIERDGTSETWSALYDEFVAGRTAPPPHYATTVEDPVRVADIRAAFQAYRRGALSREALPELRDVLDPEYRREMGLGVREGLDAPSLLVNACAQCHTQRVAEGKAQARFLVDDLSALTAEQRRGAIQRLQAAEHDPGLMPPLRFRSLTDNEIARAIAFLRQ